MAPTTTVHPEPVKGPGLVERQPRPKRQIIDLSFEVYQGMVVYPSVAKPVIVEMENHEQMARSMGTVELGITHLPNHCMIVTGDHVGTHPDPWGHVNPTAPPPEPTPPDHSYGT